MILILHFSPFSLRLKLYLVAVQLRWFFFFRKMWSLKYSEHPEPGTKFLMQEAFFSVWFSLKYMLTTNLTLDLSLQYWQEFSVFTICYSDKYYQFQVGGMLYIASHYMCSRLPEISLHHWIICSHILMTHKSLYCDSSLYFICHNICTV